jgi:peptide chain release factor 2
MAENDFWSDRKAAESTTRHVSQLKDAVRPWSELKQQLDDAAELYQMASDEGDDTSLAEIEQELPSFFTRIEDLELRNLLNEEDDEKDAIVELNSGAGGTEAADWTEMLMRLYTRWFERSSFQSKILDLQPGDEAGIKSATIEVTGPYAYGYLKAEAGVHRLVRISPFDSNKRRHTSFASMFVFPAVDEIPDLELRDEDLQVDTFRAGGAGGQHVNKTSSAVRMTHLPTGITVQCQNERSQLKNKKTALKVLTARVYQHFKNVDDKRLDEVESTKKSIDFGSQIRSYVFHPYKMVKDHRTSHETGNVQAVMDGDIDAFIKAYLLHGR